MTDYKEGDILTFEHANGSKLIGKVERDCNAIVVNYQTDADYDGLWGIQTLYRNGFTLTHVETPKPPKAPFPTEDGVYVSSNVAEELDKNPIVYVLYNDGWLASGMYGQADGLRYALKAYEASERGLVRLGVAE